jgi:hypothetical protein
MPAITHAFLLGVGLLAILVGLGLAIVPRYFAFLAGPGAGRPRARQWTRYQGLGFMLLGAAFVMAAGNSGDLVPTVVLAMVACLLFAMAVLRRQQEREARQRPKF